MIKLKKMSKKEYKVFIKDSIKRYAKEGIKSGIWTKKEALKESKAQYKRNLGKGFKESKYDFYNIHNDKTEKIGYLWLMKEHTLLFVAEIYIHKQYRHQGYGKALLKKVEKIAKKKKYKRIGLTVATNNMIAQSLYKQSGFGAISEFRIKKI